MAQYTLRYDGGSYIGQTPLYEQALGAARGFAQFTGLSVLVRETETSDGGIKEIVVHPDGDITHLWDGER